MVFWITVLLGCQLAGEALVAFLGVAVPGPVFGMALLFCGLVINKGIPGGLQQLADALLANLSLLFVPAGVGVILHFKLLADDLIPITVALVASTLLTIAVTSTLMTILSRKAANEVQKTDPHEQPK